MSLLEKICNFFRRLFLEEVDEDDFEIEGTEGLPLSDDALKLETDLTNQAVDQEEKINASKRTLITKLYIIEQEIEVFRDAFPDEFAKYKEEIKCIKEEYNSTVNEINKDMTFEIDPETDSKKIMEIDQLEKRVKSFINNEVRFFILSQKLQRLAVKLNILYNVSISHHKESDKDKAISQVEHAISNEKLIVQDFKESDYILNDKRLKERLVTLISFVDYEILKTSIRNSDKSPESVINALVSTVEFIDFDYYDSFKAFVFDELSDLGELLADAKKDEYNKSLEKRISKLLEKLAYSAEGKNDLSNQEFWDEFISIESNVIEKLKLDGIGKETARVKLIDRMDIHVSESEVLTSPKTNAYLALANVFSMTKDIKILALMKLFNHLTEKITYKEIYFLLLLFDGLDVISKTPNELYKYITKYIMKYPYDNQTIRKKKGVLNESSNKEYLNAFPLDGTEDTIVDALESLELDFIIVDNNVYINSFYFNGLENVHNSLLVYTTNTTI